MSPARRAQAAFGAVALLSLALSLLAARRGQEAGRVSPVPAADNPGPAGLEAAWLHLSAQGRAAVLDGPATRLPPDAQVLLTALPYAREVDDAEREAVWAWVAKGGTLVVLGAHDRDLGGLVGPHLRPDSVALEIQGRQVNTAELGQDIRSLLQAARRASGEDLIPARPALPDPLLQGVGRLAVGAGQGFAANPGPAVPLLLAGDTPVALSLAHGQGRLVALAGSEALANARVDAFDNPQLLANLSGLAGPGRVYFDEYHHRPGASLALAELASDLGPPLLQLLALGLVLGLAGVRRLGPIRPAPAPPGRTSREYATQLGHLYRRARAEGALLAELHAQLRARLLARRALAPGLDDAALAERLRRHDPALAERYLGLSQALGQAARANPTPERYAALVRQAAELEAAL